MVSIIMTMEYGESQLRQLGDADLAKIISGVHDVFKKRHLGMTDIALPSLAAPIDAGASVVNPLQRNPEEDILTALGLTPEQVAQHPDQITQDTKAYVGSLVHYDSNGKIIPIFEMLADVEHIYTSSEREIPQWNLTIGGRKPSELERDLDSAKINLGSYARDTIRNPKFTTLDQPESIRLVMPTVRDFGFDKNATTKQIFDRADELRLAKSPAEVGLHQRLADQNQRMNTDYFIGMDPITDRHGDPDVFYLRCCGGGLWLGHSRAVPGYTWHPDSRFVFSLRK